MEIKNDLKIKITNFFTWIQKWSVIESRKISEKKEIILHIGMHKTGTTSIQEALHGLDTKGIRTVRFDEKNHSRPMKTIFSEDKNIIFWKNRGFSEDEVDKKIVEYTKILEEELNDKSVNLFLLSGENMSNLSLEDQQKLCRYFIEKNFKVKVIYVIREPAAWSVSMNQQRAKGGGQKMMKLNPRYKERVEGFLNECGQENIMVYKYEDLIKKGLLKSFSKIIGVKLNENNLLNVSMTSEALALLYVFNNIKEPTTGNKLNFRARRLTIRALIDFFSVSNGFSKINPEKYDVISDVEKDLTWLSETFGITYTNPFSDKLEDSEIDRLPDSKAISEFFEKNSVSYDDSLSLIDNFENLYINFLSIAEND